MSAIPQSTLRHFPDGVGDPSAPADRDRAICRLLEDGDRADLAWLVATIGPAPIRSWIGRHAARRLSRRSRAFWCVAAGVVERRAPGAGEIWPLA